MDTIDVIIIAVILLAICLPLNYRVFGRLMRPDHTHREVIESGLGFKNRKIHK